MKHYDLRKKKSYTRRTLNIYNNVVEVSYTRKIILHAGRNQHLQRSVIHLYRASAAPGEDNMLL